MCGGGGGDGGAGEIRRQEAEREFKRAQATRQINQIFGLDDPSLYAQKDFGSGYSLPVGDHAAATRNKNLREAQYTSTGNDVAAYLRTQLDDYYDDAQQEAKFRLGRSGLSGGQQDIDLRAKILETFNRGLLDVRNQADSTVAGLRGEDEAARANLINQINQGMDANTAVASATTALRNNIDSALAEGRLQQVANLFAQIGDLYKIGQYAEGQQQARIPFQGSTGGATIANPRGDSGRIVRY